MQLLNTTRLSRDR